LCAKLGSLLLELVKVLDLLGDLTGDHLNTLDDLARHNLDVLAEDVLDGLPCGRGTVHLVAATLHNLGEIVAATAVPGEEVGGIGVRKTSKDSLGGNRDDALLQVLGGDGGDG